MQKKKGKERKITRKMKLYKDLSVNTGFNSKLKLFVDNVKTRFICITRSFECNELTSEPP